MKSSRATACAAAQLLFWAPLCAAFSGGGGAALRPHSCGSAGARPSRWTTVCEPRHITRGLQLVPIGADQMAGRDWHGAELPTHRFKNPKPTLAFFALYACTLTMFVKTLKHWPLALAYAIWSGVGTAAVAMIGVRYFGEKLTLTNVVGMVLVCAGVVAMYL